MAKNWAIVIGINQYNPNNLPPLRYAKHDAERVRVFFHQEARFNEVCFFSDDSPDLILPNGIAIPTRPTVGNLRSFLNDRFEQPFLSPGDNCWFFFAGHGILDKGRDYLMPQEANPRTVEETAIAVSHVRERLCRSGADNVILILDACRNEGSRSGAGVGSEPQQGVITISACSPTERSWEIEDLEQGAFTHVFLEALQIGGEHNCATVERLNNYLHHHVPKLCREFGKHPEQHPRISADPATKLHLILPFQTPYSTDVDALRQDAYDAEVNENLDLAIQLWTRVLMVYPGDPKAIEALKRIGAKQSAQNKPLINQSDADEKRKKELAQLYSQARQSCQQGDWQAVLNIFERTHRLDPTYPDAEQLLTWARKEEEKQKELARLYSQARQASRQGNWQAVLNIFECIHRLDPNYPDAERLLTWAHRVKRLEVLYRQGRKYMDNNSWSEALKQFQEIQRLEPGYRDTEELIIWLQKLIPQPPNKPRINPNNLQAKWSTVPVIVAGWAIFGVIGVNLLPVLSSKHPEDVMMYLIGAGISCGAVNGLLTGLTLRQTNHLLQWKPLAILVFAGLSIGGASLWLAGLLRESESAGENSLVIVGAIVGIITFWVISQKLAKLQ